MQKKELELIIYLKNICSNKFNYCYCTNVSKNDIKYSSRLRMKRKHFLVIGACIFFLFMERKTYSQISQNDSLALISLYDSTDGPNWENIWDLKTKVEDWYGVNIIGERVTSLNLEKK